ncbi:hypothetical protein CWC21_16585 [Pseudoalteromonas phenolica]|nr:hypothetical protein CWC21_16585 [Pseudoalteromonas phenolica]
MAVTHSQCFCGNKLTMLTEENKTMQTITDFQMVTTADHQTNQFGYSLFNCTWCNTPVERIALKFNQKSKSHAD